MFLLRILSFPLYPIVALIIRVRNLIYDHRPKSQFVGSVPTIVIGNLKVGGTGKTPFANLVISNLKSKHSLALLSRGYGRKSRGYVWAEADSLSSEIGDEAKMLFRYNPEISVAVCERRSEGIKQLEKRLPKLEAIILDDAMQHRAVRPTATVMLTEFSAPFFDDRIFPLGWLRDDRNSAKRADIVVVTKSPEEISLEEKEYFEKRIREYSKAEIFFSSIGYSRPTPILQSSSATLQPRESVVTLSAIASAKLFEQQIAKEYNLLRSFNFGDHHSFSSKEIEEVVEFAQSRGAKIVTTSKDSVKIIEIPNIEPQYLESIFVQEIEFDILELGENCNKKSLFQLLERVIKE